LIYNKKQGRNSLLSCKILGKYKKVDIRIGKTPVVPSSIAWSICNWSGI